MCYCVYLGTNFPQQTSPFEKGKTYLYLNDLKEEGERIGLKEKFSKSHIYYVGSHSQCSCGFNYIAGKNGFEDHRISSEMLVALIQMLTQKECVEFYCCWAGDYEEEIEERLILDSQAISLDKNYFGLTERQFIEFY